MSTRLTIEDLKEVRRLVHPCAAQWYSIGIELNLHVGELDTISAMYTDPKDCLTAVLKVWLKSINPLPTWNYLADVLESDVIGQASVAEQVRGHANLPVASRTIRALPSASAYSQSNDDPLETSATATGREVISLHSHQNDRQLEPSSNSEITRLSTHGMAPREINLNINLTIQVVPSTNTSTAAATSTIPLQVTIPHMGLGAQNEPHGVSAVPPSSNAIVPHSEGSDSTINVTVPDSMATTLNTVTVSQYRLGEHGLAWICEKLFPYSYKWKDIARGLKFTEAELCNIEAAPLLLTDAPFSYLRAMLSSWLQWAPGDTRGSRDYATMEALRRAVDRAGLGRIAHEL